MSSFRPTVLLFLLLALACLLSLAACSQAFNLETNPTPTAPAATVAAPSPTDTLQPASPTASLTALPTETPTLTPTLTVTPEFTATEPISATVVLGTEVPSPTPSATPTNTNTPVPCFGSLAGFVIQDLNQNRQFDSNDPGVMGAIVYVKDANGTVGMYTTGSGQFGFPGLLAGPYTLSETPPTGYEVEDSASVNVTVACGVTATVNFYNVIAGATPVPTFAPTPSSTPSPSSNSGVPVHSSATGFTAFTTGPVSYISGCGSIGSPGVYYLTTSLSSHWDCIQIFTDNVILDCQGFSLNGYEGNGYGVVVHHTSPILGRALRNVEIRNCNMTRHRYGIFIDAADNLYIHDNNTSGNYNDTDKRNFGIFLGLVEGGGIRVNDTRGALVSNNRADSQAIGLDIRQSTGIILHGNNANANTAWGIHFYGVTNSEISSNTSSNNIRYCTWGSGVVGAGCDAGGIMLQSGSSHNLIANNTISGSNGNGIFIKAHGEECGNDNTVANNHIYGSMYNAIELSFCRNNRLQGNEINDSLDGIWMGFSLDSEIDAGNYLHDLTNHGLISWNSQDNNVSNNKVVNSREAMYFYSSDYKKEEFWFVPGEASDHVSRGNCLCANTISNNSVAAFHLANSIKNRVTDNTLTNNGTNFLLEGNTSGNITQPNDIHGGAFDLTPRFSRASLAPQARSIAMESSSVAPFGSRPLALTAYDLNGRALSREEFIRTLATSSPYEPFDLRWFKYKLRISLGIAAGEMTPPLPTHFLPD